MTRPDISPVGAVSVSLRRVRSSDKIHRQGGADYVRFLPGGRTWPHDAMASE